jgi:hypothetical protein
VSRYGPINKATRQRSGRSIECEQLRGERTVEVDPFESDQDKFTPLSQAMQHPSHRANFKPSPLFEALLSVKITIIFP